MAKKSVIARNAKRIRLEAKFRLRRAELKKQAHIAYAIGEVPFEVQQKLQAMPKNSHQTRIRRRCNICGRARGAYRRFGLCRLCFRKLATGWISGVVKASW